ncbi:molybdopterin molybdotransferase MoeA [Paenibacillus gansuensis]|uniref:Molybdopterin molybdenumtransferase n=1 Tax=Paenibacillus gansuensis TaxID=306542 RepID=A0ABW5PIT8_9BACL
MNVFRVAPQSQGFTVEEAAEILCSTIGIPSVESISLDDAGGRTLAETFVTPFPLPPFRRAAMDGYAIRSEATCHASPSTPVSFQVKGRILPGSIGLTIGEKDQAVRIFTGSPVPAGMDSVVMQERVEQEEVRGAASFIRIQHPCKRGEHVAEAGEDLEEGVAAVAKGTKLGAKEAAILASFGMQRVTVYSRPKVAVIPIGNELILPKEARGPHQIYDANGLMTEMRLRELGASVIRFPPVQDDPEAIVRNLTKAYELTGLVITIGGISVGDCDFAAEAAERSGAVPLFRKVKMRPGKPTSGFRHRQHTVICLSGNPSACYAGLELLVRPVVLKACGHTGYQYQVSKGVLAADVIRPSPYTRYLRSFANMQDGRLVIYPLGRDRAGNIGAFSQTNAFAVIPPGGKGSAAGEQIQVILLDHWRQQDGNGKEDFSSWIESN